MFEKNCLDGHDFFFLVGQQLVNFFYIRVSRFLNIVLQLFGFILGDMGFFVFTFLLDVVVHIPANIADSDP